MATKDSRIDKRKVTMRSVALDNNGHTVETKVEDYVRPDFLDAYVQNAHAAGWQSVEVSKDPDAGPGGYHGATHVPAGLDHPLAGQSFDATQED